MNEEPHLKPCPFCGAAATFRWSGGVMLAECTGCFTSKGDDGGEDFYQQAADNWNRRVAVPEELMPKHLQDAPRTLRNSFQVQDPNDPKKTVTVVYASFAVCLEREANSLRATL